MVSPPSSLPSPTPSSGSHHHTFSSIPPISGRPIRDSSSMSSAGASSSLQQQQHARHLSPDGSDSYRSAHSPNYSDSTFPHLTPQPPSHDTIPGGGVYGNANPHAYLPQVTSSPPPHVPQYVPPPQHAMAPDPIHMQMSMMASSAGGGGGGGPGGPPPLPPWGRMPPPGQTYRPSNAQNGQQPAGPTPGVYSDPYGGGGGGGSRPGSQQPTVPPGVGLLQHAMMGNGHRPGSSDSTSERRRRRGGNGASGSGPGGADRDEDKDGEEEVISTIFVVGFPDDMSVSPLLKTGTIPSPIY